MAYTHLVENVLQHLAVPQKCVTLYNYAAFHFPPELGGFPKFHGLLHPQNKPLKFQARATQTTQVWLPPLSALR